MLSEEKAVCVLGVCVLGVCVLGETYFLQFALLFHQALFPISHKCLALPYVQSSVLEVQ